MANYSFNTGKPLSSAQPGQVFERCNFTQRLPHTPIFAGISGLIFRSCNLVNCEVPVDAVVEDCLVSQIEFCPNLHPPWDLPAESVNCSHVTDIEEIWVDGELVETLYQYEDRAVS